MFRTELTIAPATGQLPRTARVLTMGSCFADSIGSRLATNKVETLVNPFGTVFQPLALMRLLRAAAGEEVDWQQHLVEARGRWQSYDLHGSIGADSPVALLQNIQELVRHTGEFLRSADVVMLTLGTAWAYRLRETGELVNNCHKQSADLFVRELLTPDEIINGLAETHAYLRRINPNLRFVLTVSPVRHLKDTLQLNSVSKSVLRLATHIVSDLLPGVAYFPAYELLMDDLRDYRFYGADMLHPSAVAEDYVWEKFARAYFDADFGRFRKDWAAVRQSLEHRPLHAGAPEHRQFLESTREKLEQLSLRKVDVGAELNQVRTQIAALPVPQQPELAAIEDDEERIDIGEVATDNVPQPTRPVASEGRPPRLSPEEFRAQRGRRDGRGKGQPGQPSENEQFQTAAIEAADQIDIPNFNGLTLETDVADQPINPLALTTALVALDLEAAADEELVKKKKRRSRGGAKRTARKNALRLAADGGEATPEADLAADAAIESINQPVDTVSQVNQPEVKKSSVITKSVPVKRGGRRDDGGRVPRVPLFAADIVPLAAENVNVDAELPSLPVAQTPVVIAADLGSASTLVPAATPDDTRNNQNRNRNRNRGNRTEGNTAPTGDVTTSSDIAPSVADTADRRDTEGASAAENSDAANAATNVVPAARQPRRKARPVSAARAEKPAIDTPVIPVQDSTVVRTQVAAGRMTGSSASLIVPTALLKKAVAVKKIVAPKAVVVAPKVEAVAPAPVAPAVVEPVLPTPTAKPKLTPKPKKAAAEPVTPAPVAAAVTKAPAKPKAAPVAKPAPAVATPEVTKPAAAKKAPAKPTAPLKTVAASKAPSTKATPAKAVAPKKAVSKPTAKPEAKPVAQKPKPPKKSGKA